MKDQLKTAQGKKSKKKEDERVGGSITFGENKLTLMCKCTSNYTKHTRKAKTKPVLAYILDPKLRELCPECDIMPFVVVSKRDADKIKRDWDDDKNAKKEKKKEKN